MCHRRWHEFLRLGRAVRERAAYYRQQHRRTTLEDRLAELEPAQAAEIGAWLDRPPARAILFGIAEFSPYLFDLARADAARLIRLLACDPEAHLAALLEKTSRDVLAAAGEADVMHLLRRMKSEAALLIALCDIGGVWPVMRVTAALTDLAVSSVQAALRFLLRQEIARGRMTAAECTTGRSREVGLIVLAIGKMGAGELNYSSDIDLIVFFDPAATSLVADIEPAPFFVRVTPGAGPPAAATLRRRLRVPRRSAPAARSGLDAGGDFDRRGAALLRARGADLRSAPR